MYHSFFNCYSVESSLSNPIISQKCYYTTYLFFVTWSFLFSLLLKNEHFKMWNRSPICDHKRVMDDLNMCWKNVNETWRSMSFVKYFSICRKDVLQGLKVHPKIRVMANLYFTEGQTYVTRETKRSPNRLRYSIHGKTPLVKT